MIVIINTSESWKEVDLLHEAYFKLPEKAEVILRSYENNFNETTPG